MVPSLAADYMTVAEVARALRVEQETVRSWIRKGSMPAYRFGAGRVLLVKPSDVEALLHAVVPEQAGDL